ncbi:MAG TPA: Jag N-terminal domain-containing protein, partial [Candidatus Hydrogenedentes bacterium]|nr:Jag N-terminal domain-containing protein [Candidatus Hydrogenedentota bacterium]
MRSIEVSAKTRELAINDALSQLGVDRDEVYVEILDEGSKGFLGLGARAVKLRVSTEVPGPEPVRARPAPQQPQRPRH